MNDKTDLSNLSALELTVMATEAVLREDNEYNALVDEKSDIELKAAMLAEELKEVKTHLEKREKWYESELEKAETIAKSAVTLKRQKDDAELQMKEMKKLNPKKLKAQVKRIQEGNATLTKENKLLKEKNKRLMIEAKLYKDRADTINMSKVWSSEDLNHHLVIYPTIVQKQVDGKEKDVTALLYLNDAGRGGLLGLDSDNDASFGCKKAVRPSKETLDVAGRWLRKTNITQGGRVTDTDLQFIG